MPSSRRPARSAEPSTQADIHERIYNAIVEQRQQPGTKLTEERLAELFKVSRPQVRGVLQRLAVEQLVTLVPNRGAFVATPTSAEARDVLAVRRTLEPSVVLRLIESMAAGEGKAAIQKLRALVKREKQADASGDRRTAVRLPGEFHLLLAELTGSRLLTRMMRELTPLTCLAILAFEAPTSAACPNDEHVRLIDAIEAGNAKAATALMIDHLHHIESSLRLDTEAEDAEVDLADLLLD